MSKAPRKLELSDSEVKVVEDAFNEFGNSSLETEKLFDLFKEWQSLKTRSLKRFVLSLSFLLSIAWVTKLDITEIEPLGFKVSEADPTIFLISLLIIHLATFIYHRYQRSVDMNVNKAKISLFEDELSEFLKLTEVIDKIIEEGKAKNFPALTRDVIDSISMSRKRSKAYSVFQALSFFKKKLEKEQTKREWGERIETFFIYALALVGLISIIISFFK